MTPEGSLPALACPELLILLVSMEQFSETTAIVFGVLLRTLFFCFLAPVKAPNRLSLGGGGTTEEEGLSYPLR